jgi:hypothetical protein
LIEIPPSPAPNNTNVDVFELSASPVGDKDVSFPLKLFSLYSHHLQNSPLLTKSLSASFISTVGDLLAQSVTPKPFDLMRSLSFFFEGLLISGPMMSFSFSLFESMFPTDTEDITAFRKSVNSLFQLMLDTIFMDTFYVLSAFMTSGLFEGLPISLLIAKLRTDFVSCLTTSWMSSLALSPLEIANFRFVPKEWRTIMMNFTDVLWNAFVSFGLHSKRQLG